jgi:phospholipid transport system substrate-binding protein
MVKINSFKIIILFLVIVLQSCSPAMQEVDSLLQYINKTRDEIKSFPSEQKKQTIFKKARKRFLMIIDTEFVAKLSLGKYFQELTSEEKKEYINIFHELMAFNIVKTYIPVGTIIEEDIIVELMYDEHRNDRVFNIDANIIHTRFSSKRVWYYIDFYLHQAGKKYKMYDVRVDGASVLLDYRHQFEEIIRSKGVKYLLDRLRSKYKELDAS